MEVYLYARHFFMLNQNIFDENFARITVSTLNVERVFFHSFLVLSLKELETTDTLENAMASPAKTGESSQPKMG